VLKTAARRNYVSHYGLLGIYDFGVMAQDIRGATLYGLRDEKLGKINDVIFDHSTGDIWYVVVDAGGWLKTKNFIVPAVRLQVSNKHEDGFTTDLMKEQVEKFPKYEERDLDSEEKWADYEARYRSKWEASPVMHRAGTDRNITPTTQQLQGNQSSLRASGGVPRTGVVESPQQQEEDVDAADAPSGRIVSAGTDSVVIENSAVGIGGRWDTFQARLRERRKEAVSGCRMCSVPQIAGSETADTLKKAV
jgi:PRC-barrel domain